MLLPSRGAPSPPQLPGEIDDQSRMWKEGYENVWQCDQKIQNVIKTSQLNVQNIYICIYIHTYIMFSVQTGCDVSQIWRRILTAVVRLWLGCAHWDPARIRCALMHADADTQTDSDVLKAHKNIYLVYTNSMHSHMLKSIEKLSLFGGANRFTCFGVLSRRNWTLPWWSSLRLFWPQFIQPKM